MRHLLLIVLITGAGFLAGCRQEPAAPSTPPPPPKPVQPQSEVLLRWHFAGADQLAGNTNAAKVKEIWALPATAEFRKQGLHRLAGVIPGLLSLAATATNAPVVLRPLVDDLVRSESVFEMRREAGGAMSWCVSLALNDERAALWQTNVATLAGTHFERNGKWVVFASTADATPAKRTLEELKQLGRPAPALSNDWLEVEANLPRWAEKFGWPAQIEWPQAQLTVNGKDAYLRSTIRLHFAKPSPLTFDPWQIPTNIVHDPVISFTAARGVASWLKAQPWFQQFEIKPAPNQAYVWAQQAVPTQTFVTVPAPDARAQMERLGQALMKQWNSNLVARRRGEILLGTNRTEVLWARVPVPLMGPFLRPAPATNGDYLLAGMFPPVPSPNPLPKELLAQVSGRTNLIYYDWEVTEPRLMQWHQMFQLATMLFNRMPNLAMGAGQKWTLAVAPKLGNTVTEVTVTSPQDWLVVRKSHLGFTGIELALLAHWLEGAPFPWEKQPNPLPLPPGIGKPSAAKPASGAVKLPVVKPPPAP